MFIEIRPSIPKKKRGIHFRFPLAIHICKTSCLTSRSVMALFVPSCPFSITPRGHPEQDSPWINKALFSQNLQYLTDPAQPQLQLSVAMPRSWLKSSLCHWLPPLMLNSRNPKVQSTENQKRKQGAVKIKCKRQILKSPNRSL